jgi:uncharacterized protein
MPFDVIVGRNEGDNKILGKKALAYIGKSYVNMENYTSLSNPMFLDISRSHVVMVAGKRGSGKCLSEDSLVLLEDGSEIPIIELDKEKKKIVSVGENLKIIKTKTEGFYSREVLKLLKIKLRSGREIKLTLEHPLLTIKGWAPASDIKIKGRIATPRRTFFGKESYPKEKIKLLAYLLTEGHLSNGFVLFSNDDPEIVQDFKQAVKDFDKNLRIDIHSKDGCFRISQIKKQYLLKKSRRNSKGQFLEGGVIYQKSSIRKWLEELGMYSLLSKEKFIPKEIFKLKKEDISLLLARMFSCDGTIYKKKTKQGFIWEISYCSSSEKMIRQVQSLLLKFGIQSKIREKNIKLNNKVHKSFELILNELNSIEFIESIGFYGAKVKKQILAKKDILIRKKNPNVDTIPKEIWDIYKPKNWANIGRAFGYKFPKAMRERKKYSPSRETLLKIGEFEKSKFLKNLATSDIFWDEIVSIEELIGKFNVYDISVPEQHNFIANNVVVHNSYSLGVISESISEMQGEQDLNISSLIFDTMGIFWTMKFKNYKDKNLLSEWGLEPKNIKTEVFAPAGYFQEYSEKGIPVDKEFRIKLSELNAEDWVSLFELNFTQEVAVLLTNVISKLKEKGTFNFQDIFQEIEKHEKFGQEVKNSVTSLFEVAKAWKIFDEKEGTAIIDLVKPGQTSIIDLSMYSSIGSFNVRALVISLVCKKLFIERMGSRKEEEVRSVQRGLSSGYLSGGGNMPLVWIFIDEAHEFLVKDGKTPASDALIQLLREGRQPGISLVLATQQPGKIHTDAMTQSDIVISHKLTSDADIQALNSIMQSYVYEGIKQKMNTLPKLRGSAILLDDNSERIYQMRFRPRFTWHGGEAPSAVKEL